MRKRGSDDETQSGDRWLMTYSDMMNNACFVYGALCYEHYGYVQFDALARELEQRLFRCPDDQFHVHLNYNELIPLAKEELEKTPMLL